MRVSRLIPLVLSAAVTLAACGGGDDDTATTEAATTIAADGADQPEAPAETAPVEAVPAETAAPEEAAEPAATGAICDSIPSVEAVTAVVGEPFATAEDLSDPTGDPQQCQLFSDTGVFVGFSWLSEELGSGVHAQVQEQGESVAPYDNPALPGALAYANTVSVLHEGRYWEVQVVNPFVAPNAPELFDLAGQLLVQWIEQA